MIDVGYFEEFCEYIFVCHKFLNFVKNKFFFDEETLGLKEDSPKAKFKMKISVRIGNFRNFSKIFGGKG